MAIRLKSVHLVQQHHECVTYCVQRLVLPAVQLVTVVEDIVVCGVETGFDAVSHNLAGSGRRLQLLDLDTKQILAGPDTSNR